MSITIVGGGNPSGPTFPVQRSVRLRSSASAYFNRTPAAAGNRKTWTYSVWLKRGNLATGALQNLLAGVFGSNNDRLIFESATTCLTMYGDDGIAAELRTTQVFRDPSAWYHIVLASDTTQATASNRWKLYVNGVQVTSFSTANYPALNRDGGINNNTVQRIGAQAQAVSQFFDGYLAEINFIDGLQLTPTSFGSYNSYGVWSPAKYTGTYGTNGFYLNFQDNSAATATTIGKDSSGNGNNWTPNNISVTAGVTYDSMLDVPTLTSANNANFPVLNPLKSAAAPTAGNLQVASPQVYGSRATMAVSSGKWYWEVTATTTTSFSTIGVLPATIPLTVDAASTSSSCSAYYVSGSKSLNGTFTAYGASWTTGDIIGVALDCDSNTIQFYKNNAAQGSFSLYTSTGTEVQPFVCDENNAGSVFNINFGQRPFTYTPPSGFKSLNTYNIPAPTIPNGAAYMAATTYTGNGTTSTVTNTVNGTAMQPDLVWVKSRSLGTTNESYHFLVDSVRGLYAGAVYNYLNSNTTAYQNNSGANVPSSYGGVTTLNSNGFSVTGAGSGTYTNQNAATYVGWQWKANGATTVTNTSGSIPSTVSANTTNGFSIVTWIGNNSAATIGHGLGVAPAMYFVKQTTATGDWFVYHQGIGATKGLFLELTNAATTNTYFNNTASTSTVFSVGGGVGGLNATGVTQIAYCWAEIPGFSKFGSYTGNGSTDGPFVYLGFRPRFVLVKSTSAVGTWELLDSSRDPSNPTGLLLRPPASAAELNGTPISDFLSNGFKPRSANGNQNDSGVTYIYAAFAENPFNYSLAR